MKLIFDGSQNGEHKVYESGNSLILEDFSRDRISLSIPIECTFSRSGFILAQGDNISTVLGPLTFEFLAKEKQAVLKVGSSKLRI